MNSLLRSGRPPHATISFTGTPCLLERLDDHARAEGRRLDQRAVDLRRVVASVMPSITALRFASTRIERLPFHQSSASRPLSPGLQLARLLFQHLMNRCRRWPSPHRNSAAARSSRRTRRSDRPRTTLAGLVAEEAGDDAVLDVAAHALDHGLLRPQQHVAHCWCP